MTAWDLVLAVAVAAGLVLVLAFPQQCRTTSVINRVLVVTGRWALNLLLTVWVLASWRRVTRNLGLAYTDRHAIKRVRTIDQRGVITEKQRPKVAYPWLLARPDAYGVVLTVWTRAGIGRSEFEDAAEHLANTWRCRRVQVEQRKPGRVTIRGLRRDPLDTRLSLPLSDVTPLDPTRKGGYSNGEHRAPQDAA